MIDSGQVLTQLKPEGYQLFNSYEDEDRVTICGFIDQAKQQSLDLIGEVTDENSTVIASDRMNADAQRQKIRIPDGILLKPVLLDEEVYRLMRIHTDIGKNPL